MFSRELRWRCWCCCCVTYVRVARIRRHPPHTLVCTTSADIPLETTAFHISKHHKLVDFTATSSSSSHSSWAFWFGFQSSRSSIHPHEELAKFSKGVDFGEFYLLTRWGKDLSPFCFSEREREKTRDWVLGFFFWRTLTCWKIERREERSGEYSAKLLVILECINLEHRRCRAFITLLWN